MQTAVINKHSQWPSPKHPSPSRPLPPPPLSTHLIPRDLSTSGYLLSHLVPSPSLQFDELLMSKERTCDSPEYSSISSETVRDSLDSFMESYASLLPHATYSDQILIPQRSMDSCSAESWCPSTSTLCSDPFPKRNVTPEQLDDLSSELADMHMARRDSAIFDTTQPKSKETKNRRANVNSSQSQSQSIKLDCFEGFHLHFDPTYTPSYQVQQVEPQSDRLGETSFIEWDDETPRLAKMKKSIVDLKAAARTRSNSLPLVSSSVQSSSPEIGISTTAAKPPHSKALTFMPMITDHTQPTKRSSCSTIKSSSAGNRPRSPIKPLQKRRSLRSRKTDSRSFAATGPKRLSHHVEYNATIRVVSPVVLRRRSSSYQKTTTAATTTIARPDNRTKSCEHFGTDNKRSNTSRTRRGSFTRWMRKIFKHA